MKKIRLTKFQIVCEILTLCITVFCIIMIATMWNDIPLKFPRRYVLEIKGSLIGVQLINIFLYLLHTVSQAFPVLGLRMHIKITPLNKEAIYQIIRSSLCIIKLTNACLFSYISYCMVNNVSLNNWFIIALIFSLIFVEIRCILKCYEA